MRTKAKSYNKSSTAFNASSFHTKRQRNNHKSDNYDDTIESDEEMNDIGNSSSSSLDNNNDDDNDSTEDSADEKETAGAKKIRLARDYLFKMEQQEGDDEDEEDSCSSASSDDSNDDEDATQHDNIGRRLARERLRHRGMLEQKLAYDVSREVALRWDDTDTTSTTMGAEAEMKEWTKQNHMTLCRGHDLTCTSVALDNSNGGKTAYSASKDNSILMWDVERQIKIHSIVPRWDRTDSQFTRNSGEVLAMDASDDGRYLAVGGRDAAVRIYDVRQQQHPRSSVATNTQTTTIQMKGLIHTFEGHKGPITALTFRTQSSQLFSGSSDRCIRHYNLQELSYIETLYGHQASITGLSCHGLHTEMPFSVGRDRTARAWKIAEDTHLIFRGGAKVSNADCVAALRDEWFLTGHDDGLLALWTTGRKRAVASVKESHGVDKGLGRGVGCCDVLGESDLALTGSNDGYIRVWKASTRKISDERGLVLLQKIPVHGYVNDIAIGPEGKFCVAAIGQEPRLGRWDRVPRAKNRFAIIQLKEDNDDSLAAESDKDGEKEDVENENSNGLDDSESEEEEGNSS